MTVSMRVMSAGDGYRYLLRTVVAGDGDRALSSPLTRYYAEVGTPPGSWIGAGVRHLGDGALVEGGRVSEVQLQLLIGMGHDPVTGAALGREYQQFASTEERVAERVSRLPQDLSVDERARAIVQIEAEEAEKRTRKAVAGYDYTFSVPKSVSVLWAVADAGVQSIIANAHHAATAELIAFLEREVASTRVGATGPDGAVAQVDVAGVAATAFDHYDSRAGDPQLHTHVVISNKVLTVQDDRWRSLDGRPMHAAVVALSELYNAVLADHLTRALGLRWERRERGRDRNPAWEIDAVPDELIAEFSSRSRHIDAEARRLIEQYVDVHGRQPSPTTILKMRAQATLATRPEKEVRSLAELTAQWRTRATQTLHVDAAVWAQQALGQASEPAVLRADDFPLDRIDNAGRAVVSTVGEKRSTWRRWNLHAEASRQLMGLRFASMEDRKAVTEMIVDAAERASLRLTPPELASSPAQFRFPDGATRFRPRHASLYSSVELLEAEDRLLRRADDTGAPAIRIQTIERHTLHKRWGMPALSTDQIRALTAIALSGRTVDVLVGPAGAGKTTAMNALRHAWEHDHGRGSVVGLAPSATAADVLADDLGIPSENTAKWLHTHATTGESFAPRQLVIVDEASLAGTTCLDQITECAERAGAKVLLVGDYAQLQSVDAGGAFAMLVHARTDAPELTDIHRFGHAWERVASLELRHGRSSAIDSFIDHDRVKGGDQQSMIDAAYTAWQHDTHAGLASILIAETHDVVTTLNQRAHADLVLAGRIGGERGVLLHDGTRATAGDVIIARKNDRRLRSGDGNQWVHNGSRWTVTRIRDDGSITIRPSARRFGGGIVLPAAYVAEHVDLGYAVTAHRAQGTTTDTAHYLVTSSTTRENLYVGMTRGRESNRAYVAVDLPDDAHAAPHPADDTHASARSVLYGVLHHVGAELSAHEAAHTEQDRWGSIAQLAAEYETIAQAAQHERWIELLATAGLTSEQVDAVTESDTYGALSAELRFAEANHHDLDTMLPRLVASRTLEDAADIASVLHERLSRATTHPAGTDRARQRPALIVGLIPEVRGPAAPDMRRALDERRRLLHARADAVLHDAIDSHAPWTRTLGTPPQAGAEAHIWMRNARTIAAYRDRYLIDSDDPIGAAPASTTQKIDAARAATALKNIRALKDGEIRAYGHDVPAHAPAPEERRL